MKDYFKRFRAEDKFLRHECLNKTARQRAKREVKKMLDKAKNL